MPTLIKISFGIFVGMLIAWLYFRTENKNNNHQPVADSLTSKSESTPQDLPNDDSKPESPPLEQLSDDSGTDRIILQLEDPDKPPYRGFISASQNGKQLFTFNLPDGKSMSILDSLVEVELPDKPGTNLIDETFRVLVCRENCVLSEEVADWTKVKINGKDFNKGNGGGGGAGSSYSISYYSFDARAYSEPVTEIDGTKEEEVIETILKNMKFN